MALQVREIRLDNLLYAPDWTKALVLFVVTALTGGLFWQFVYIPHQERVERLESQIERLKVRYLKKKTQVAKLPALRAQFQEIQNRMREALKQLPGRSEVASLLDEVTRAGRAEGLVFEVFRPKPEKTRKFYAEVPVELKVRGSYNALGRFLAATATLPRIVNFEQVLVRRQRGSGHLLMKGIAKTFRDLGKTKP